MTSKSFEPLLPVIGVVGLLAIWTLATSANWVDPVLLPSPYATFSELWKGMDGGVLGFDFVKTVYRTAMATLIAAVIAIPLGIVLGSSEKFYRSLEFVIDFFRSTPASAMFPLFLVLFGVGDETKISVAAFGAILVILFNVAYGVMNARKTRLLAAKVMGASRVRVLFDVMLWESLPQTFVGFAQRRLAGPCDHRRGGDVHRFAGRIGPQRIRGAAIVRHAAHVCRDFRRRRARLRSQSVIPGDRAAVRSLVGKIVMAASHGLNARPASEQARLIREKKASAVEVLEDHLAAIEKFNPQVNAVVTLVADEARAAARRADAAVARGENLGPLHGVPVGIKDVTPTAGIRTTYGSPTACR